MKRFLLGASVFLLSGTIFASEGSLEKRRMSDAEIKGQADALISVAVKSKKIEEFTQLLKRALELKVDVWYQIFSGIVLKLDFKSELSVQKIEHMVNEFTRRIADPALQLSGRVIAHFIDFLNARKELKDLASQLYQSLKNRQASISQTTNVGSSVPLPPSSPLKPKQLTRSQSAKAMAKNSSMSQITDILEKRRKSMEALHEGVEELPELPKKIEEEKNIEKEHEETGARELKADQERQRQDVEARKAEEAKRAEELLHAEVAREAETEPKRKDGEAKRLEEERMEAARVAEVAKKAEEAKQAEELCKAEEERKRKTAEAKRLEEERMEAAHVAEVAKKAEEAQKADEERKRGKEEARQQVMRRLKQMRADMVGIVATLSQLEIENLLSRAEKCYLQGDRDEAHHCFMRIQDPEIQLPQAIKMRALAWLINCHRERRQSFDCFQSLFEGHPTLQAQAYAWVGVLYYKANQYEAAKSAFGNVLRLWTLGGPNADPEAAALAWAYCGDLHFRDKEYEKAKNYLERAAKQRDCLEARQFAMTMLGKFSYYGHGKFRCNIL